MLLPAAQQIFKKMNTHNKISVMKSVIVCLKWVMGLASPGPCDSSCIYDSHAS